MNRHDFCFPIIITTTSTRTEKMKMISPSSSLSVDEVVISPGTPKLQSLHC